MVEDTPFNQLRYFNPDRPPICITMRSALNLEPSAWYELFANKALVDALLDRLQHRCITIRIDGPSLRTPEPASPASTKSSSKSARRQLPASK